jgi:hypothetical protein
MASTEIASAIVGVKMTPIEMTSFTIMVSAKCAIVASVLLLCVLTPSSIPASVFLALRINWRGQQCQC